MKKPIDIYAANMLTDSEKKSMSISIDQELIDMCTTPSAKFLTGTTESVEDYNDEYVTQCLEAISTEVNKEIAKRKVADNLPPVPPVNHNIPSPQEGGWPTAK